ncbi:MATE family efflux transporter [Alkalibacterium kapii]|uniref:Probable multidrug resistance protein NorM n=1 Tax=Alkalibacterium kapii TaxID=426704 RepID=A0A511AU40_9LACT|nr:MATE family efflux transporter [Alkalibacterium kapii]GEK90611.1 MATE family efflux transporter [Alkalibacterium kapii]
MEQNKMGIMPINKLLISMSLPMMISMIVQSLYNVVDSIFVAQLSENALTAVTLAFPVQNLMIAIQVGTGVGMNALLSRRLGENRYEEANNAASNGVFISILHYLVILILGLTIVPFFFRSQTSNPEILAQGESYMRIIMIFSLGLFMQVIFEKLLQGTGKSIFSMWVQGSGAIINIVLDPLFIFGWFGFPALGVTGAAVATVIGQTLAATVGFLLNYFKNDEIKLQYRNFRPHLKTIKDIYIVGIPSSMMIAITSVTIFSMNKILLKFSPTAIAVFGVYFRLQSFAFMPIFGLNNGMIPIVAFNYGARSKERIKQAIRLGITYAMVFMMICLAIFQFFPVALLNLFNASPEMLEIGIPAMRIISISFLFAGFSIIVSTIFQAFGKGTFGLYVSIARQLVVLIPLAYLFSLTGRVEAIWWSYPVSELVSALLCVYFLRVIYKKYIEPLPDEPINLTHQ